MSRHDLEALDLETSLQGKVLNQHYLVERKVAQGGMAWLFQVRHVLLDETMALKLLYPHLTGNDEIRLRFIDEAKIQFRLKHPNIIQVTEILQAGRLLGIVQEWISGSNLKEHLRYCKKLLTLPQIRGLMEPILDALHYAHQQGIVHRDVKPGNILLSFAPQDGLITPKLTDFGVAKLLDELDEQTATGVLIGTFKFTSPEQIRESKTVDQRTDIYSIGVMLYQLCTGSFPFTGGLQQVLVKHLLEEPKPPRSHNPALPEEVEQVIMKCLAKQLDERYQTCQDVIEALAQAIPQTEPLYAHPIALRKTWAQTQQAAPSSSSYQMTPLPLGSTLDSHAQGRPYAQDKDKSSSFVSHHPDADLPPRPQDGQWTSDSILSELFGDAPRSLEDSAELFVPPGIADAFENSDKAEHTETHVAQAAELQGVSEEERFGSWELDQVTEGSISDVPAPDEAVLSLKIELEEPPDVEAVEGTHTDQHGLYTASLFEGNESEELGNIKKVDEKQSEAHPDAEIWEAWQSRVSADDETARHPEFDSRELEAPLESENRKRQMILLIVLLGALCFWYLVR